MAEGFTTPFVASIDEGTQSCRFMVFDKKGKLVAVHQEQKKQIYPQPGWCEHDPMEIINNVNICIDEVCEKLEAMGYSAADIKGVGITNQRETTVVWDKVTGEPLHNAVVWLDMRTSSTVEELIAKHGDANVFLEKCGLPISTYFSAVKLKWLLDNKPEIRAKADAGEALFGTIDTWLLYKLGGVHVTDVTNAARTMLMDLKTLQWDQGLCKAFGIPMSMLPEIRSSAEVYCAINRGAGAGLPLAACLGDQQSAMVGHAAFRKGDSKNTYGTGCFMLLNTGETAVTSKSGLLTTVCYKLGPDAPVVYALEGSVAIAGMGISWLKDNLNMIADAKESSQLAASVRDTGGVYLVPAFSGLFAPHWRQVPKP
jgi:glycerol kinase